MDKKKKSIDFIKLLTEMAGIVFAVLLALWLENVMADNERQEQANELLLRIENEILENKEGLITAIEDNQASIDAISNFIKNDGVNFNDVSGSFSVSAGSTSDSAWEAAKITQAFTKFPLDTVTQLNAIYDTQEYYKEYVIFAIQEYSGIVSNIQYGENTKQSAQRFVHQLSIINALAEDLMEDYDSFLSPSSTEDETASSQSTAE